MIIGKGNVISASCADATPDDVRAAALQYVRKIAGMRKPSAANLEAFNEAVADIAAVTEHLLGHLQVRQPSSASAAASSTPASSAV
jgi:hypothetical protein